MSEQLQILLVGMAFGALLMLILLGATGRLR